MKIKQSELKAVIEEVVKEVLEETKESEEASDTDTNESEQVNESPEPTGESPYGLSPEMERIRNALAEAEELLYEHGSDPELSDTYIALFRALQHAGVNLNYVLMSV